MNNIRDLRLKEEILPLFDHTLNSFAKEKLWEMMQSPLDSQEAIDFRQHILKGFLSQPKLLEYSYTVMYVYEVHLFFNGKDWELPLKGKKRFRYIVSKDVKSQLEGKYNQAILWLYRLLEYYFLRLDLTAFPKAYQKELVRITDFLNDFDLGYYALRVREFGLKAKDMIHLSETLAELKREKKIARFWEDLFQFEAYLSVAQGIRKQGFVFPSLGQNKIALKGLYHPLLRNPVKNDFELAVPVAVLNGPNMSGKSTFLKALGLCMYLGHLGFAIPAEQGELPLMAHFSIGIDHRDDLQNGYSHFMTEIKHLKAVLVKAKAGEATFAVFDELFSGTNATDALEICQRTISGMSRFKNSFFLISTHLEELRTQTLVKTIYVDCDLKEGIPVFSYKVKAGWSDIKVGRILFEKEGLDALLG
jgi:DNA mismatch repair protein MutS